MQNSNTTRSVQPSTTRSMKNPSTSSNMRQTTSSSKELKAPPPTFFLPLNIAFYITLASHTLSALYAPIQDCDETFNYWEPLHYLTHGYGLQTWEYSPTYSIRSWAYVLLYAGPVKLVGLLGTSNSKSVEFYSVRIILGLICAASETRLYSAICKHLNPRIGVFYIVITAFTPGVFHASTALLPSSFAMYTTSLGLAAFLDKQNRTGAARGIMWFAVGALLGWPFSGVLIVPFVAEDAIAMIFSHDRWEIFRSYVDGALRALAVCFTQVVVDSLFYNKLVFVAWKIVSYNVFSGDEKGPDIFGTEPWHFYIRNLILNFNIWILLAFGAVPLLVLHAVFSGKPTTKRSPLQMAVLLGPFYLWVAIFTLQPHKEERFMFPAYPFLALNAAVAVHIVLNWIGSVGGSVTASKTSPNVKLILIIAPLLVAVNIGLLRILGTVTAYRAPLQVFDAFSNDANVTANDNVCIGKDWYRFPSSFFLPNDSHLKFVKSNFDGLLPGEFAEAQKFAEILSGIRVIPTGMNDRNEEDFGKYTSIEQCSYMVDSLVESFVPSANEPKYLESNEWEKLSCSPFLDPGSTHVLARTIWVPDFKFIPVRLRRRWGEFCLLKRKNS